MELTVENVKEILPTNDIGWIYMELYNNVIPAENFVAMFGGDDGATLTFDWLYNHENATEGWKKQFSAWKNQGILN